MATKNSIEMQTLFSPDSDPNPAAKWGGRIRTMQSTLVAAGMASGDIGYMGRLPQGAIILPGSKITATAANTFSVGGADVETSLQPGTPVTAAKYMASQTFTANEVVEFDAMANLGVPIASKNGHDITVTLGAAGIGNITMYLQYVVD